MGIKVKLLLLNVAANSCFLLHCLERFAINYSIIQPKFAMSYMNINKSEIKHF
jgi:hypothetical protein